MFIFCSDFDGLTYFLFDYVYGVFQMLRSSEKANAAAVSNRFAGSNAVKAVVPKQPRFLFLNGFGNAVFDLCQVEIGVLEVVPREQAFLYCCWMKSVVSSAIMILVPGLATRSISLMAFCFVTA